METIVILLDPRKLENPDLDLRYLVPDRIEEVSDGSIQDNGYDYIDTEEEGVPLMGIWLQTEDSVQSWPVVAKVLREEKFLGNDLSASVEIYISKADAAELESCTQVFPE